MRSTSPHALVVGGRPVLLRWRARTMDRKGLVNRWGGETVGVSIVAHYRAPVRHWHLQVTLDGTTRECELALPSSSRERMTIALQGAIDAMFADLT